MEKLYRQKFILSKQFVENAIRDAIKRTLDNNKPIDIEYGKDNDTIFVSDSIDFELEVVAYGSNGRRTDK